MKYIFILLLLLPSGASIAQNYRTVTITINNPNDPKNDSTQMVMARKYFPTNAQTFLESVQKDKKGNFYFIVREGEKFANVTCQSSSTAFKKWFFFDQIAEPGDSIVMSVQNKQFKFSGRGHEKFEIGYRIYNGTLAWLKAYTDSCKKEGIYTSFPNSIKDSISYKLFPRRLESIIRANYSKLFFQLNILNEYRDRLSPFAYELIKANLTSSIAKETHQYYNLEYRSFRPEKIPEELEERIHREAQLIFRYYLKNVIASIPEEKRIFSTAFRDLIVSCALQYPSFGEDTKKWIIGNFTGELKDRLLTEFFIVIAKKNGSDSLIPELLAEIKTDFCRETLVSFYDALRPGSAAFDFTLTKVNGEKVSLRQLKGKTLVMDFWFTGCVGCLSLARHMKMIQDSVKNRPDIVFLSVSIDKDSEMWKKSVASGQYSGEGSIDVYTGKNGTNHPLINHYKIFSFPRLIVIGTDSRLISSNPERPIDQATRDKFVSLISQ
jgi:thiol-disulfide isomerase/thioredoxin